MSCWLSNGSISAATGSRNFRYSSKVYARCKFWTRLSGPAELQYGRPYFLSPEGGTDFTEEVGRGWQVRVVRAAAPARA